MNEIVQREWGTWEVLDEGSSYKVKKLTINPGKEFSLQYHNKRKEHWYVVSGVGMALKDNTPIRLMVDKVVNISVGQKHKIRNDGEEDLVIIEIQRGTCREEDIVRLD